MKHSMKKVLSLLLVLTMVCGLLPFHVFAVSGGKKVSFEQTDNSSVSAQLPLQAVENGSALPDYKDSDTVRVSIVLEDESTIAAYATSGISENRQALKYRAKLRNKQSTVEAKISEQVLAGKKLDAVWNLTLVANMISANVQYGQISQIKEISGVADVVIETCYEPMVVDKEEAADPSMATSSVMTGSSAAYMAGYTGAGTRIAIIDTGIDTDHQSFDADAFLYSLEQLGGTYDLLDAEEIAAHLDQLHISSKYSAEDLYVSAKVPFGYNYVDQSLTIDHDHDSQGEHGSHVTGIAAANAYIPNGDGTYASALDSVQVQGVAPDAQILTMKVFGQSGGAYDSDYMAAIEDAVILGADVINLSLGAGNPGYTAITTGAYQEIFENLEQSDTVVTISTGNSGSWVENSYNMTGYLYSDDVSMQTGGAPGTYTNSLSVGSVENDGAAGEYFTVAGQNIVYAQTTGYTNEPLTSLAGTQEYVYIDGYGTYDDLDPLWDVIEGRILVCSRGSISFFEKATNAVDYGAIGTIIYNNTDGMIYMDLSSYEYDAPCVSICQADGAFLKENAEECVSDDGGVYYLGTMEIAEGYGVQSYYSDYYTMSDFSSWGVPGSLEMKPEITAPGGSIYSVDGSVAGGQAYEVMSGTSMAAPQVAGMAALVAQYIKEKGLDDLPGLTVRTLSQSLLMSTAQPLVDGSTGSYWSVLQQGAGLANVGSAIAAQSYILMGADATASWADGKVNAELGDDPDRDGVYSFSFSINNLTDETQKYALSADLFTQGLFRYYVNETGDIGYYMDTATAALDASAVWTVDGKVVQPGSAADFDGDGDSDGDDCDALLAYIAGELESIHDLDKADYDGDGSVTSYDAYLFLLDTGITAEVPANGSVTVSVKLTLSKAQKAFLDDYYTAGAYIEGYIYAEAANTAEGVEGTSHSIPVLGFYGDWSEPSMYEVGSQVAYSTGSETRLPYAGDENANYVSVKYADLGGKSYYFGGNPIFSDSEYDSDRNAINSLRDSFDELGFMLIRNAAAGRVAVCKDGQIVYEEDLGAVSSAFYYVNGGYWAQTSNSLDLQWSLKNAQENESYTLLLQMATEYSVNADGSVDWDSLGAGATLEMPFTIDNTAPVLESVEISGDEIVITVKDNQYLAALGLADAEGTEYAYLVEPEQDEAGQTVTITLDGSVLDDAVYLLQVYDYAMNCTTYRVFFNVDMTNEAESVVVAPETVKLLPGGTAQLSATVMPLNVSDASVTWTSTDETVATVDEKGVVTAVGVGQCQIIASSVLDSTVSGLCQVEVFTIEKELNGIVWDEDETVYWASFNTGSLPSYTPLTGELTDVKPISATYDEDGVLYGATMSSDGVSTLYTIDPETFETTEIGSAGDVFYADMAQSPTYDMLLALYGPYILIVDRTTGEYVGYLSLYDTSLVGIAYCGSFYYPTYRRIMDSYLLIDAAGNVYRQCLSLSDGYATYSHSQESGFLFNCDADVTAADYFSSAYYDGSYLYWSVYDTDSNRSKLYAVDIFEETAYEVGAFNKMSGPWAA